MATTKTIKKTTKATKSITSLVSPADIEQMKSQQHDLVVKAEQFKLTKPTEETEAYAVLGQLKSRITLVEKRRKDITQPLNTSMRQINALFKTLREPLVEADRILRSKIGMFRRKQEAEAAKRQAVLEQKAAEAEAEAAKLAARKRQTAGTIEKTEALVERRDELEQKAEAVTAKVGDAHVSKRWTFRIESADDVPRDYLVVDTIKIRQAVRAGERDIPGVRIYQEESVRVY